MPSFTIRATAVACAVSLFATQVVAMGASEAFHSSRNNPRRHHARRANGVRRSTCKSSSNKPSANAGQGGASNSSSSSSSSSSGSSVQMSSNALKVNDVYIGFLPDDGDAGGVSTTMAQLNSNTNTQAAAYGWYAQPESDSYFSGNQLLSRMADIKACNCVFQPAVMPTKGWGNLKQGSNSLAVQIAQVMKKFTDEGIPVWLRFGHEMNWYQQDGTYPGNAADFKEGWATVAAAVKQYAPEVKMFWTPNVAGSASYAEYAPDDMSTVDYVGVDYYPHSLGSFVSTMKSFHDTYAVNGRKFALGETGLGYAGSVSDRISWLKEIVDSKSSLSELVAVSWFDYQKGYAFQVAGTSETNGPFKAFVASG